eukprot:4405945-Prorocentrum_lima.AAC.1
MSSSSGGSSGRLTGASSSVCWVRSTTGVGGLHGHIERCSVVRGGGPDKAAPCGWTPSSGLLPSSFAS